MSEETLETAARRIIRFVRIDDAAHGGLLSRDTIRAADTLEQELRRFQAADQRKQELPIDERGGGSK
jgi:hypothetical protein